MITNDLRSKIQNPALTPYQRIVLLFSILRSPDGCKWDRQQTHQSLVQYLIEEAYEVVESIERERYGDLKEELGDLMTQIVFHAQLAGERGEFTLDDVINGVVDKLVARHPHVFGEAKDLEPEQVRDQWERIKTESGEKDSVLGGLPRTMPALTMAFRVGEKAGGVGFDWKQAADVIDKVEEELGELKAEMNSAQRDPARLTDEIGDLLFAVASLSRKLKVEPEAALRAALGKFRNRFDELEKRVRASGRPMHSYTLEELEAMWQQIKLS